MRVIVKAILQDQKELKYRIKKTSALEKAFKAISEATDTPLNLLRFTYKEQSLKGSDTILSANMNDDGGIVIHVLRTDSSSPDENGTEIPQMPVAETNDAVIEDRVEQLDCANEIETTIINDDVIDHQPEDAFNGLETSPSTSSPEKENIEMITVEEQICGNENPLKRKYDEKLEGSSSKVCKVEPLKNFQANNLLISNMGADVNQKKVAAEQCIKKISELNVEVVNINALEVLHANDLSALVERQKLSIDALNESHQNEMNDLKEAHRKALDEAIAEKNVFVDTQSHAIGLMKQSLTATFNKNLKEIEQNYKDEIETMKEKHRKDINDKEDSQRKSLVELSKNNNEVIQKIMAEKFQVIESQNKNFEAVKKAFAEEKQDLINEKNNVEKTCDQKLNTLKKEMNDAIAEMIQSHDIEIQKMKDDSRKQMNELKQLKDDVINNLATKMDGERRFFCDQISQLKDDVEEQKESHQKEIVGLRDAHSKALIAADHKNNIESEDPETINKLKKQLFDKSKFHGENVQNIIKKCDIKRMKDISGLKGELKSHIEAHAIEMKRLTDEIEVLNKNRIEIKRLKSEHNAERTEWNRKFEKDSKENDKLHEYVINQLKKNHESIVQELQQKSNQKLVEYEKTMKEMNEQKTTNETELKTSKENHIRTVTKLQSEIKKIKEINSKMTEELKKERNERMKCMDELKHLRMNCGEPGKEQLMLAEIDRLKPLEQSYKYLTEQYSICYNENINLKSSHQQLDQTLTDKTKAFDEFQTFHKKRVDQLQAECHIHIANLNSKTEEFEKLTDMRRVEEDVRNAAHQNEILNLIGQHRQDMESVRSEMVRKIKESSCSQATPTPAASVLPNDINACPANELNGGGKSASPPITVSSSQSKAEPKVRKCDHCGNKARFVTSYSYCSPLCNVAYCLKKTNSELDPQQLSKQP